MSNATTIPSGNIHLRATDFILLSPGFEVPAGKELYLDVNPCVTCTPIVEQLIKKELND
jgi:deoxycytidylate deaminase